MNFTTWTNEQLNARVEELRGIAENPGERTTEELEQLAQERAAIDAELEKRRNNAALDALRRQQVAAGGAGVRTIETMGGDQRQNEQNEAEARAREFMNTRHNTIPVADVRAVLLSSGTLATPTQVSGINDLLGRGISSILDLVYVENCQGMSAHRVAYMSQESAAAADQTEGSAVTARTPTFDYVTITPDNIGVIDQISKQVKKQTPLQYAAKVNAQALKALKKAAVAKIVAKLKASALVKSVAATLDANNKGVIDEKTLRNIVLSYGGNEDVVGGAVLFLNKTDLIAFGDVRGTNEKKAVYEIIPDGENTNMGIIKDGGMSVRYCIVSGLTALAGTAKGASAQKTLFYGDPKCFELDLFSDYEVRVSEDFAMDKLMDTIVGDAELGGDVVVKDGFVTMSINP
ncbi:MAG: phage major capsid protein [Clostridia bacterium]|nr:phage major capsid protein [Clostridia bacterium]